MHDFSRLACSTRDLPDMVEQLNTKGIHLISNKKYLSEAVLTMPYPPEPTILNNANLNEREMALQILI